MLTPPLYTVGLTAILSGSSALVAYIITDKLAGNAAAARALYAGLAWAIAGTLSVLYAWRCASRSAPLYQLYDGVLIFFGANSLLLAVAMPLFFAFPPTSIVGTALAAYALAVFTYQGLRAYRHFEARWSLNRDRALARALHIQSSQLNTDVLIKCLKLEAELLLPGKLSRFGFLISFLMLTSMVIGLNLRKLYPQFSAFAYGIPALTFLSVTTQIALFRVLIARKLIDVQRKLGTVLAPTDSTPTRRTQVRKRRRC